MANKYLSSVLLFVVCCSVFIGSSSEAAKLYTDETLFERMPFAKAFGLVDSATGTVRDVLSGTVGILSLLSGDANSLGDDGIKQVEDSLDHLRDATDQIKMTHSILLAILLWPLALVLCCPGSCCLGGLVCCIVIIVVLLLAIVLAIVGLILFTPGFGDTSLPYHAASTAEIIAQTLDDITRETVKALDQLADDGHSKPVAFVIHSTAFIVDEIRKLSEHVNGMLNRDITIDAQVRDKLESVDVTLDNLVKFIDESVETFNKKTEGLKNNLEYDVVEAKFDEAKHHRNHRDHYRRKHGHRYFSAPV